VYHVFVFHSTAHPSTHPQVYYVQQSDRDGLEVTLAGRHFKLSKGAFLHVPPGATFKISNLSEDRAAKLIFFIVMVRVLPACATSP
jgi:glyoxylate utilization-related uncharacterized protein